MDDKEFERLAETILASIESMLEDKDLDFEVMPGGVIEVDLASDGKIIINRHRPSQEIWVAARSGAWHYRFDGAVWRDTRSGEELLTRLSGLVSS